MREQLEILQSQLRRLFHKSSKSPPRPPVVALLGSHEDRDTLLAVAGQNGLNVHFAETCAEAWNAANELRSPIVFCDRELPGAEWQDTVRLLASAEPHPCVILASRVLDDYLWKETVSKGGYDVLFKPLRMEETARCIKLALTYWKSTAPAHARPLAIRR